MANDRDRMDEEYGGLKEGPGGMGEDRTRGGDAADEVRGRADEGDDEFEDLDDLDEEEEEDETAI